LQNSDARGDRNSDSSNVRSQSPSSEDLSSAKSIPSKKNKNSKIDSKGIDAYTYERIRQLESGISSETTIVIENPFQSKSIFLRMVEEAQEEITIIFSTPNSVKRKSKIGLFNLLKLKNQEDLRLRILSPNVDIVKEILLLEYSKEKDNMIDNVTIREIAMQQNIRSTILIIDKKQLLTLEIKDNTKETFEEATGLATYSTSPPTVLSYLSIFEILWTQTEMFDNLRIAHNKLAQSEEMEREFINTAAHELRTPTQAIMGYVELDEEILEDLLKNNKITAEDELNNIIQHLKIHFDAISRNSSRLNELINNLLDVARIESNRKDGLLLHKIKLDLVKEIIDLIKTQLDQKIKAKNIKINLINKSMQEEISVYADRLRLNQIIDNLIGNAIKFSNQNGVIDVIVEENTSKLSKVGMGIRENNIESHDMNIQEIRDKKITKEIFISISDTGKGISPQIMSKLFEKFATDSDVGTGLGLFITRNLIEAHGGRIWAFNNTDGVGSTFVFSLPQVDDFDAIQFN
jgi:signal transduction histidine kinase